VPPLAGQRGSLKESRQALFDSISRFGISYDEFTMAPGLIAR
jgi:hypothetical protein